MLKEEGKSKFIRCFCLLLWFWWLSIAYFGSSSSPNIIIASLPIADFHALIIKATCFSKPFNDKSNFPFKPLTSKIKPSWKSIRASFLVESDFICILCDFSNRVNIARLKVTLESSRADGDNSGIIRYCFPNFPIGLKEVGLESIFGKLLDNFEFGFFGVELESHFFGWFEWEAGENTIWF